MVSNINLHPYTPDVERNNKSAGSDGMRQKAEAKAREKKKIKEAEEQAKRELEVGRGGSFDPSLKAPSFKT